MFFNDFFGSVRQKTFDWYREYSSSLHLSVKFFDITFSETQKFSPTMFFDTVRHQLFDGRYWCPLFYYRRNFSMPEIFRNIERTMYKFFRHCETKDFQRNLLISSSYAKDISIPEFIWNTERVSYKFFRRCETKIFQLKLVICRSYA